MNKKITPTDQVKLILLEASKCGARLFRRNVGFAWTGNKITRHADGSITIHDPRPFNAGVKGQYDTYGWRTVTVTADMVGQQIAQVVEIEVKQGSGRETKEQRAWGEAVRAAGGIAGVARSVDDVAKILNV